MILRTPSLGQVHPCAALCALAGGAGILSLGCRQPTDLDFWRQREHTRCREVAARLAHSSDPQGLAS